MKKYIITLMLTILMINLSGCEYEDVGSINIGNTENKGTEIKINSDVSVDEQLKKVVEKNPNYKIYEYITLEQLEEKKANKEDFMVAWTSELCEACQVYKTVIFQYINYGPVYPIYYIEVSAKYPEGKAKFDGIGYEGTPTTEFYLDGELVNTNIGLMDFDMLEEFIIESIEK